MVFLPFGDLMAERRRKRSDAALLRRRDASHRRHSHWTFHGPSTATLMGRPSVVLFRRHIFLLFFLFLDDLDAGYRVSCTEFFFLLLAFCGRTTANEIARRMKKERDKEGGYFFVSFFFSFVSLGLSWPWFDFGGSDWPRDSGNRFTAARQCAVNQRRIEKKIKNWGAKDWNRLAGGRETRHLNHERRIKPRPSLIDSFESIERQRRFCFVSFRPFFLFGLFGKKELHGPHCETAGNEWRAPSNGRTTNYTLETRCHRLRPPNGGLDPINSQYGISFFLRLTITFINFDSIIAGFWSSFHRLDHETRVRFGTSSWSGGQQMAPHSGRFQIEPFLNISFQIPPQDFFTGFSLPGFPSCVCVCVLGIGPRRHAPAPARADRSLERRVLEQFNFFCCLNYVQLMYQVVPKKKSSWICCTRSNWVWLWVAWFYRVFTEFSWVTTSWSWFRSVWLRLIGFSWFFSGFLPIWLRFPGFHQVQLGFTRLCLVFPSITGFYWVLHSFTGFHQDSLSFIGFN